MAESSKRALYDTFATVGHALASPHRLVLLDTLCQGERTVELLAREAGLSMASASAHLQVLRRARLVDTRREGTFVFYRLSDEDVFHLLRSVQSVARRHMADCEAALRDYLEDPDEFEPVPAADLLKRLRAGEAIVLDVRPTEEFLAGHLPGAINIPPDDVEERLAELSPDRPVVAYCRGPYCVYSVRAARILRARGVETNVLEGGLPDWRAQGLPVERGVPEGLPS